AQVGSDRAHEAAEAVMPPGQALPLGTVMAGLVPAIHVFDAAFKSWMPAASAGMTWRDCALDLTPACWLEEIRVDATDAEPCIFASSEPAPDAARRSHGPSPQQARRSGGRPHSQAIARGVCRDRAGGIQHLGM